MPSEEDHGSQQESHLLEKLAQRDAHAANAVFSNYSDRLQALARSRLSRKLAGRIDADDVLMSAFRSFFVRAQRGDFEVKDEGDLWRLLVEITLHKLYRQTTRHQAQRRSVGREEPGGNDRLGQVSGNCAPPDVAVALSEELAAAMAGLPAQQARVLELRLEGRGPTEIAQLLGRSERTIRRWLEEIKEAFRARFPDAPSRKTMPRRQSATGRGSVKSSVDLGATSRAGNTASPNEVSFEDLVLQEQVGAGATGKVYRALDRRSGCQVAVKFLRKALLRHSATVERFLREARLLSTLSHPAIIRVLGLGQTKGGGRYLVLDWHPCGDLGQAGTPAWHVAANWVRQAAQALDHAHSSGVVHCDLKPSNLLLADDGRVVVTDFGLACLLGHGSNEPAGTPAFLAPEQIEPAWGNVDARTDVYGLGALLYSLAAGRPPREGSVLDVLTAIASGQPVKFDAAFPPRLVDICRRCLAPAPGQRFESARALADALEAAQA